MHDKTVRVTDAAEPISEFAVEIVIPFRFISFRSVPFR